jgi:hypothetical protein
MPDTAERWRAFLGTLTDEELERYREIVGDQLNHEREHRWLQIALAGLALAAAVWFMSGLFRGVYWVSAILMLGLTAALGYWPYRRAKSQRLWLAHRAAVEAEQARRRSGAK